MGLQTRSKANRSGQWSAAARRRKVSAKHLKDDLLSSKQIKTIGTLNAKST